MPVPRNSSHGLFQMVILSKGRPEGVTTQHLFPTEELICVVPDYEADQYREHNPDLTIVELPEGFPAGEAPVLQFILDNWASCVQLDDDLTQFTNQEEQRKLSPDEAFDTITEVAELALDMGVYLYGFSPTPMPTSYHHQTPFTLTGFIIGGAMGFHEGHGLYFNQQLVAAADYWISGLNAAVNRLALCDRRHIAWDDVGQTFQMAGGQQSHRSLETEERDTRLLIQAFGSDVVRAKRANNLTKAAEFGSQRTLAIPF